MKNVIVAYDGSDAAKRALDRAADLVNGATVTVVSGVHIMAAAVRAQAILDTNEVADRRRELEEAAGYLRGRGIETHTIEARGTDVGDAIVDEARAADADLIVVGSTGKNMVERLMLGSVSTKVVHEAPCDVLVVR